RLGKFVKFIPYPVIAGFINGFAIHLLLGQMPPMLGERSWGALVGAARGSVELHPGAAMLGLLACLVTVLVPRVTRRGAPALWGLGLGTGLHWVVASTLPEMGWGGLIGAIPATLPVAPQFGELARLVTSPVFAELMPQLVATSVMLALIGSLQSLLSISAADAVLGTRHDSNHELILQGAGNVAAGLLGGMPTGGSPSVTRTVLENGGRSRTANLAHGLTLAVLALGLGEVIGQIPTAVMAGVVVASTFNQMDDWSRQLIRQLMRPGRGGRNTELIGNLGQVLAVTALVVGFGVLPALVTGMTLAFAVFVRQASQNIIRRTVLGTHLRSRTSRPASIQAVLKGLAERMAMVEVQGPIFFGSADQLTRHLEENAKSCRVVILDMKRVSDIDGSGVVALERLDKALGRQECLLFLSYVAEGGALWTSFEDMGFARLLKQGRAYADTDAALTCAEDLLLREAGINTDDDAETSLEDFDILKGMSAEDAAMIGAMMKRIEFAPGMAIVSEGDDGDSLYLVAAGRVTVSRRIGDRVLRFSGCSAGISFGELGVLTGRRRGADVVAETRVVCWHMDGELFRSLCRSQPELGQRILTNVAIGLADLVSSLSDMARELEQ
ncbi:MAG: SLC26A/SulP transporter family protein, partial [Magnetospirillum sp.]|nr:SLC26A/SulP transporter family protein [Magnetospirillum sp.]